MTCVAGVAKNGKVWIGSDSASSQDEDIDVVTTPKAFRRTQFLYGYAGCWRTGQLLQHVFKEPKHDRSQSDMAYLVGPWVEAFRTLVKGRGMGKETKFGSEQTHVTLLLGYHGSLYTVEHDFAILESAEGINAVGSGSAYALGAMYVAPKKPPALRVRHALEASARYCASVAPPFTVLSI